MATCRYFSSLMKMFLNWTRLGGPVPLAVLPLRAVVLEARCGRAPGRSGIAAPGITVLPFRTTLTVLPSDRDLEPVPLADRLVGLHAGRDGGASSGGRPGIRADAVHLARADRPAPDVDLILAAAAEVDAGIGVGQREPQLLAVDVPGVGAVGQDVGDVSVDVGRLLDPPVDVQDEVAELASRTRGSCRPWPRSRRRSRSRRRRPSSGRRPPRGPSSRRGPCR